MDKTVDVTRLYPDDNFEKEIYLHAAKISSKTPDAPRHVILTWQNAPAGGVVVFQMIHLTGIPGKYNYQCIVSFRDLDTIASRYDVYSLGRYTRAQRVRIIQLAENVQFDSTSVVNHCRAWMRDLLEDMTNDQTVALSRGVFDKIDKEVPLMRRQPERSFFSA